MDNWIRRLLRFIQRPDQATFASDVESGDVDTGMIKGMLEMIIATRADEIDCNECFAQLDYFVEFHLHDEHADEKFPLIADHLRRCKDCKEEFDLLVDMLEAI